MQLPVDGNRMTGSEESITLWDAKKLSSVRKNPMATYLYQTIDEMGKGSRAAQGLAAVLTSVQRLQDNPSHRLYLFCIDKTCVGIIKVGNKKLFIRARSGKLHEMDPLCVLDFYVHESAQRAGYGRTLYEFMIDKEGVEPRKFGYDRPSHKFLSFLQKHYGLSDYIPQSNNFVVFNQYFEGGSSAPEDRQSRSAAAALRSNTASINTNPGGVLAAPAPASCQPSLHANRTAMLMHPHQHDRQRPMMNTAPAASTTVASSSCSIGQQGKTVANPSALPYSRGAIPVSSRVAQAQDLFSNSIGGRTSLGASRGRRSESPTRSCVSYNILSPNHQEGASMPSGAVARPAGRQGARAFN